MDSFSFTVVIKIVLRPNIPVTGEEIRVEELVSSNIIASSQITNKNSQVETAVNNRRMSTIYS